MNKINKSKAKSLFNRGITIFLMPCKIGLNNIWFKPFEINIKTYNTPNAFNKSLNAFEHYNCNKEMGQYTHFYTEV